MKKFIALALAAAMTAACAAVSAVAAEFPDGKPITIICPVKAGGDTDRNAREIATRLSKYLKTNVIVENINGGATVMGMQETLDRPADGYTLITNGTDIFVPWMMGTTEITLDSFKTVGVPLIDNTTVLVTATDYGYKDLKDLVEKSIAEPDSIEYGGKIGATNQICGIAMNEEWGSKMRFVDVGNNAAKITALLGYQTGVINVSYSLATDYFTTGDFTALCLLGSQKNELLPDVPMASDFGYKNVDFSKFIWLGVHPDTPDDIVAILTDALKKVSEDPDFQKYAENNYLTTCWYANEEAQAFCNSYYTDTMAPYQEAFLAQQ